MIDRSRRTEIGVDWDEVRARLDRIDAAVRESLEPTSERVQAVLAERALAVAAVVPRPISASELMDVTVFSVGGERYGIEARYVRRVVRPGPCTPVPGTPAALRGLINLRGDVLAVFDLPTAFGIGLGAVGVGTFVLVLGEDRDDLGLAADAVDEVRPLRRAELLEPPAMLDGLGRDLLLGVTADALLVLAGSVLLADDRLRIDQGDEVVGRG